MDFFETVENRRSYRGKFVDKAIPREDLYKIVNAGVMAPSGCNTQTTSFVIVDDPEILRKICEVTPKAATAPAVIAVISQNVTTYTGQTFETQDYSAATQNILLALTALGYASVWLDGMLRFESRAERIGEILQIPDTHTIRVLLPLGVPAADGERVEKFPFEKRAWFNKFGG